MSHYIVERTTAARTRRSLHAGLNVHCPEGSPKEWVALFHGPLAREKWDAYALACPAQASIVRPLFETALVAQGAVDQARQLAEEHRQTRLSQRVAATGHYKPSLFHQPLPAGLPAPGTYLLFTFRTVSRFMFRVGGTSEAKGKTILTGWRLWDRGRPSAVWTRSAVLWGDPRLLGLTYLDRHDPKPPELG